MEDFTWKTEHPIYNIEMTMIDFIDNHCELDITLVDGTYAEGMDEADTLWGIYAKGDGDFYNHRISFEQL